MNTTECLGEIQFQYDFEGAIGSEWSSSRTSLTPNQTGRFLGQFGNEAVRLSLANLPAHTEATLSFDLFIIETWDGNDQEFGPDRWQLKQDGRTLLDTTFSQHVEDFDQSFPGTFPDSFPRRTGAAEINTLGYEPFGDSVYRLSYSFPHVDDRLELDFSAFGLEDLDSESWGLDDVSVTINAVPEPGSLSLILSGMCVLLTSARRHHRAGRRSF